MKTKLLTQIVFVFILGIILFSSSCKKDDNSSAQNDLLLPGTTYWECNVIDIEPDTIRYLYLFSLTQNGNNLTGEIAVRDSASLEMGTITGVIEEDDSIFFTTNFSVDKLNFSFNGLLDKSSSQYHLTGNVQTNLLSNNGIDELAILISSSVNWNCPDFFPDNPYIFRKVNSSSHPNDSSIIFIHGMTGNLTHWDDVLSELSSEFKDKHDVYLFQYNWKDSIMINGRILYDSIIAAGLSNPLIVAHSMGGLVARAYISKGGDIARLVTLGTPHLGSPLAKLANIICFMNFPGSQDLRPDGVFIQSLLLNTNDIQNRNKYVLFGGQMKGRFKIIKFRLKWVWAEDYYDIVDKVGYDAFTLFGSPPNDGLVPFTSGFFDGYNVMERKPLLEWVDHKNLRNPTTAPDVMDYINEL